MNRRRYALLTELLSQPTAPFREDRVIAAVARHPTAGGVPFFRDTVGNLVVGLASPADYRRLVRARSAEPVRVFIAHMDHPGFHGLRWRSDRRLAVKWHGGAPVKHLDGAAVWLADETGVRAQGRLARVRLGRKRRAIATAEVRLEARFRTARPEAGSLYGGFRFRAPVWRRGKRIYTKAADDLVGVFAVVATALELFSKRRAGPLPFIGLLTRAEEVGLIGATGHFELGWLNRALRPVVCVSLETSRTLPDAHVGKGPVVRLGDRRTAFDPDALKVLTEVAQKTLPKKHQRRVMDGGTCEATAATAYGLRAIGVSVPLGNYHNENFEGGEGARRKHGPAPEFVHLDDVDGLLKLCKALMRQRLPWKNPWYEQRRRLRKTLKRYRGLLKRST